MQALRKPPTQRPLAALPLVATRRRPLRPRAVFYNSPSNSSYDRVAAGQRAQLSSAISSCRDWQQVARIVERHGPQLTANHVSHLLTRLEQLLAGRRLHPAEAAQVQSLVEWLLRRGRQLGASELGPQALGATASALTQLQQAERARQQQQQQQLWEQEAAAADAAAEQRAAEDERRQLVRQLADAAVTQRHRLTPQALDRLLAALASIEESGLTADEIRQLLNIHSSSSSSRRRLSAAAPAPQQQQQQRQPPGELVAAARQLGQLSPELAQEWYDRALRQGLSQGRIPAGIDGSYVRGFLAREIQRAAARARDDASSSIRGGSGSALLQDVLLRYQQLLSVGHVALMCHCLAQLQQEGLAGSQQDVELLAGQLFDAAQQMLSSADAADAATLCSLISSCQDLELYSKPLVSAVLAAARHIMQRQQQQMMLVGSGEAGSDAGDFSPRQLGILIHSLAVLGLRPGDGWLREALRLSGMMLGAFALNDLERFASGLLLMRISPGSSWTAAAEQQLVQLAATIGQQEEEEEEEEGEAAAAEERSASRQALVSCVKALALLGGQNAVRWHRQILAQEQLQEQQRQQQQERQQRPAQELERLRAQATPAREQHLQQQLRKAARQQHRPRPHPARQRHQQQPIKGAAADAAASSRTSSSSGASVKRLPALSSLDELMSKALLQREQQERKQPEQQQPQPAPDTSGAASGLPHAPTAVPDEPAAAAAAEAPDGQGRVEAARPAGWAAEQSARWAGSDYERSPAAEVQHQLDDRQQLFGAAAAPAAQPSTPRPARPGAHNKQQKKREQQWQQRDVPVEFLGEDGSSSKQLSHKEEKHRPHKQQQPQQRSSADAASALAALMAQVEGEQVDESAVQQVRQELGMGSAADDPTTPTVEQLQAANEAVQQATQQLEQLQDGKRQRKQPKAAQAGRPHQQRPQRPPAPGSDGSDGASAEGKPSQAAGKQQRRPLGCSGEPAFVAAANNLAAGAGSGKINRSLLLGCLEAIDMQQQQLRQQVAARAATQAVAEAVDRERQQEQARTNPLTKQLQQLQQDFERARRRADADKAGARAAAVAEVLQSLLPLLDSFDAALAAQEAQQASSKGWSREEQEIQTIYQSLHLQLLAILRAEGVSIIGDGVVGRPFDPATMEAVMRSPATAGFSDGDVLKVLRCGYRVGERLVRAALVVVAYED